MDVVIRKNHIYRTEGGIWLDWMTQGTRITGNVLHDNKVQDFSLEVNHGPILVDNNLFLSKELGQVKLSQGIAFVNNIIAWKIWETPLVDKRETPYLSLHGTSIAGFHDCPCGDVTYYNNIFTRADLTPYDACKLPVRMDVNIFLSVAKPSVKEINPYVNDPFDPDVRIIEQSDGWYLQMNVLKEWLDKIKSKKYTSGDLEQTVISGQTFDRESGDVIPLYLGVIDQLQEGVVSIKVFAND